MACIWSIIAAPMGVAIICYIQGGGQGPPWPPHRHATAYILFLVVKITVARVHAVDGGLISPEVNSHLIHLKGFAGDCG